MGMVSRLLGKRSLLIYLGAIVICALGFGVITDLLYLKLGLSARAMAGQAAELIPQPVETAAALLLAVLICNALWQERRGNKSCSCGANPATVECGKTSM